MKDNPEIYFYNEDSRKSDQNRDNKNGYRGGRDNPYLYVRLAFRHLSLNSFEEARAMMERASICGSLIFSEGSHDDREFRLEMQMLRVMILFLTDKFSRLPGE